MEQDFFPNNLKYLLDSNQLSVKTILQLTGNNSAGLITMWKNGERQITTKDLLKIANHLGYTVDDLINKDLTNPNNKYNIANILYNKVKVLPEDKQKMILNVTEAVMKDIDEQLDNK